MTLLLLAVLLPLVGGAVLPLFRFQQERPRSLYVEAVVLVTSALTWWAICLSPEGELPLLRMTDTLTLTLHLDGMSKVFAGLVSFLWPLASLYGFEYMRHENRPNAFFAYYTMSYGVTLAVALAVFFLAEPIMKLFVSDSSEKVISLGVSYLHLIAFMYFMSATTNTIQGFFRGLGDLKVTLISTVINFSVRFLSVWIMIHVLGGGFACLAWSNCLGWIAMLALQIPMILVRWRKEKI